MLFNIKIGYKHRITCRIQNYRSAQKNAACLTSNAKLGFKRTVVILIPDLLRKFSRKDIDGWIDRYRIYIATIKNNARLQKY